MKRSRQLETFESESVMIGYYRLALKIFVNKDIPRSFEMSYKLQPIAFRSFSRGTLSGELYLKVTTLYLTEAGLILNAQSDKDTIGLSLLQKKGLVTEFKKGVILDQLAQIYGAVSNAPSKLIFHLFLVYFVCKDVIQVEKDASVLSRFKLTYYALNFVGHETDHCLKRFFDMFVLEVLPELGDFNSVLAASKSNNKFGEELTIAKSTSVEILKTNQNLTYQKQRDGFQAREAKSFALDNEEFTGCARKNHLKYGDPRNIKVVQAFHDLSGMKSLKGIFKRAPLLYRVKENVADYFAISSDTIKEKYPGFLGFILFLIILRHVSHRRKVNIQTKVINFMSMLFKKKHL